MEGKAGKLRVLLVCGSGASTGFMASAIRKAASKRGLDISLIARSEAEIGNYIDDIDCIMVGPHFAYIMEDTKQDIGDRDVKISIFRAEDYALFNGESALDHILSLFN